MKCLIIIQTHIYLAMKFLKTVTNYKNKLIEL